MRHRTRGRVAAAACAALVALSGCAAPQEPAPEGAQKKGAGAEAAVQVDAGLSALVPQRYRDKKTITVATSASVPPLAFVDSKNDIEITGVVVDLTKAWTKLLGLDVQVVRTEGGNVMPGVLSGRFDAVMSVGDFKSRQGTMDFVDFLRGGTALMVRSGNPHGVKGIDDLCGRSLAIGRGSIEETDAQRVSKECVGKGKPAVNINAFADGQAMVLALQSDRVETAWNDIAPANYLIKQNPGQFELTGDGVHWLAPYAAGFRKDDQQLRDAARRALQKLVEDGTYRKILDEWGQGSIAVDRIAVNGSRF
ncbi:ABC transporter substrate-binding protein [Amycolatopsis nivea]|uniref:ABC transporter substrate-binding protein n=1 Tax=Amycolatopsis nivea TaxID=1644109 RepID=UPI00142F8EEE|nr:ABC transporter substrate-binding protein [Amycolatopsis nivea]